MLEKESERKTKKSFIKGLALSMCALLLTGCAKNPVHEVIIKLAGVSLEETSSEVSVDEDMIKKCLEGYAEYLKAHTELWQYETVYSLLSSEKEITQEEYDKYVNELVEGTEYKVFSTYNNNNGYEYLNEEALDNSFNW